MPACCAIGCSNSSTKGSAMKYFPKDPKRRKLWASKVKRKNWYPTDHSVLCEEHFEPQMWEKTRVDGKKKLIFCAIPTIFNRVKQVKKRPLPKERNMISPMEIYLSPIEEVTLVGTSMTQTAIKLEPSSSEKPELQATSPMKINLLPIEEVTLVSRSMTEPETSTSKKADTEKRPPLKEREMISPMEIYLSPIEEVTLIGTSMTKTAIDLAPSTSKKPDTDMDTNSSSQNIEKSTHSIDEKLLKYSRICRRAINRNKLLEKDLRKMKIANQVLARENLNLKRGDKYLKLLSKVFNPDQINALSRKSTRFMEWSDETIKKALQLKYSCGSSGYQYLIDNNQPLPSLRTLRRISEKLKL